MISWLSMEQKSMAISTTEAKYITTSIVSYEVAWLHKFLAGIHPRHDAEGSDEAPVHIHI
jgi:hypothetical protein